MKSIIEQKLQDAEFARMYAEEGLVIEVLEAICSWMKMKEISRAKLAERLNTSRANVTQMLRGRNVSLRTIAAVVHVLDGEIDFKIKDRDLLEGTEVKMDVGKVIMPSRWHEKLKFSLRLSAPTTKQTTGCAEGQVAS